MITHQVDLPARRARRRVGLARSLIGPPCGAGGGSRGRACPGSPGPPRAPRGTRRPGARASRSGSSRARLRTGPTPGSSSISERGHRLVAPLAVEVEREPVRLVADPLQQPQRLRVAGDRQRARAAGHVHLFELLGQPDHRRPALDERGERANPGRELTLAAVDHDQVRQRRRSSRRARVVRRAIAPARAGGPCAGRGPPPPRRSRPARAARSPRTLNLR